MSMNVGGSLNYLKKDSGTYVREQERRKEGEKLFASMIKTEPLLLVKTRAPSKVLIDKAVSFLRSIEKDEKVLLLYHKDADGICGAYLLIKSLESIGIKITNHIIGDSVILSDKKIIKKIEKTKPNVIISVDLPLDQQLNKIKYLRDELGTRILVIDHHSIKNDLNNYGILHINSHFFSDLDGIKTSQYCGTKLSYDIYKEIVGEITGYEWILSGLLCDFGKNIWKELLEEVYKKYSKEVIEKLEDVLTIYGHGGSSPEIILDALLSSKKPEEFLNGENLWSYKIMKEYSSLVEMRNNIINEINRGIAEGDYNGRFVKYFEIDHTKKILILQIVNEKLLASDIANSISKVLFDYSIAVIQIHNGVGKIKFRNQEGKKDMAKIASEIGKEFNGNGGGHVEASAAEVPLSNIDKLKDTIKKYLQ